MSVGAIEAAWLAINTVTLLLTTAALLDAVRDQRVVHLLNGHARDLAAGGIVRREALRVLMQVLMLAAIVPYLVSSDTVKLTPSAVALMAVAIVMFMSSLADASERKAMTLMVSADALVAAAAARMKATVEQTAADVAELVQTIATDTVVIEDTAAKVDDIHDVTVRK